ncbi:hypothetical protein AG1IA_10124 [Rhizoctonia solani AG-1 IA]|uniref:Uncharacterized protein n=1 Tax=Thanatephorus cucumeris (strain AG1-IA) TaxID=983506 RepID=L8WD17_THACA|nr:hypothetical protein AG1IA_10124 [Rhizoctonia solani AG-1 IA]
MTASRKVNSRAARSPSKTDRPPRSPQPIEPPAWPLQEYPGNKRKTRARYLYAEHFAGHGESQCSALPRQS